MARQIGRPARLLVGLGSGNPEASVQAQGLRPDVVDAYLVGVGPDAWPTWSSPAGSYVNLVAERADRQGAVPMLTLYQMASNGDGNLAGIADATFMAGYWANVRLMFQRLAMFDKPVLVNVEPDFWGYVERQAPDGDPARMPARVSIDADCAGQPDNVTGIAGCVLQMARKYAPKAAIGFPPSDWGAGTPAEVAAFALKAGLQHGDFLVMQTLDRDAGCFEVRAAECSRAGTGWYWDDAAYAAHLALARNWHDATGLPLVWWQTPLGVPASTPGGTDHWRDNRMQYFLTRPQDLVAVGGLGVVFGAGAAGQTTIDTDGGQYKRLSEAYLAAPAPLP
ncbi:hypothetical protein I8E28_12325 [Ramlibacter sp. CrO1]|uniref:Uncharacterized protein n=1 Tax=Ramlibacter algicola TaxID=2795217 RepID=A0A934PZE3_9BURK|nr:hypothetical protein [Ramlibacter algicola]